MRRNLLIVVAVLVMFLGTVGDALAQGYHYVRGYTRRDGTYVSGHYRTNPDGNFSNNWSSAGNVNPFTGRVGTRTYPSYRASNYLDSSSYGDYGSLGFNTSRSRYSSYRSPYSTYNGLGAGDSSDDDNE